MRYFALFYMTLKTNRLAFVLFILGISFITIGVILMTTMKYDFNTNNESQHEYAGMSKTSIVSSFFSY